MPRRRRRVAVSGPASRDYAGIIDWTAEHFGAQQARHYGSYIDAALVALQQPDEPLDSRLSDDIMPNLWRWLVPRTRHIVFYLASPAEVRVLRILHVSMDPGRHIDPRTDQPG